ncbi:MAG: hypothetical protein ABR543_07245 [Gemmatimonadaceae bacterium]
MHMASLFKVASVAAGASLLVIDGAEAQRRQQTVEITAQVPTPQVVTVRPREVPVYSKQVLVPDFFNRTFWPAILPAYTLVPMRQITGSSPLDSVPGAVAAAAVPPAVTAAPSSAGQGAGQPSPAAQPAAVSAPISTPVSASREQEIQAIRLELERRKTKLDSLSNTVRDIGKERTPPDTTRRPPQ